MRLIPFGGERFLRERPMGDKGKTCSKGIVAAVLVTLVLGACATRQPARDPTSALRPPTRSNHPAAALAVEMLGSPYRYGGNTPSGFDCSGLVQYVYSRIGVSLPRSAAEQHKAVRDVSLDDLSPGDLLFFRVSRRKISHVGIYIGSGNFIHAPSSGKQVAHASLQDQYWQARLVDAGRVF